jgi:hypothetical protein
MGLLPTVTDIVQWRWMPTASMTARLFTHFITKCTGQDKILDIISASISFSQHMVHRDFLKRKEPPAIETRRFHPRVSHTGKHLKEPLAFVFHGIPRNGTPSPRRDTGRLV